jgi:hypothetical protein
MSNEAHPAATRESLAAFILRAVTERQAPNEWQHFMVAHYQDPEMERARRECVRLIAYQANGDPNQLNPHEIALLRETAAALTER